MSSIFWGKSTLSGEVLPLRHPAKLPRRDVPEQRCGFARRQRIDVKRAGAALFEIERPIAAKKVDNGGAQKRFMANQKGSLAVSVRQGSHEFLRCSIPLQLGHRFRRGQQQHFRKDRSRLTRPQPGARQNLIELQLHTFQTFRCGPCLADTFLSERPLGVRSNAGVFPVYSDAMPKEVELETFHSNLVSKE